MRFARLWTSLCVIVIVSALVDGRIYCFRRLKKRGKCGGLVRRHIRFTGAEHCCRRRGQGFADVRVKLGRNRFECTPCSSLLGHQTPDHSSSSSLSSSSSAAAATASSSSNLFNKDTLAGRIFPKQEQTTTPTITAVTMTPESTTRFVWPTPYRRVHEYAPSPAEESDVKIWQGWSPCSVSCGAGWRSRRRICDGCDPNDYENVQVHPCMDRFYCPVDGNWGPWNPWSTCSLTCGDGTRLRSRKCNYPPPAYGGAHCAGDGVAHKECNIDLCPVHGGWGEWSELSACSRTCGTGQAVRTRECNSPSPTGGGEPCRGPDKVTQRCEVVKCPVDGGWTKWSVWGECSVTCGRGVREQVRSCNRPRPQHGGRECQGEDRMQKECFADRPCPVDGGWTEWSSNSRCRARRCSKGFRVRSRTCNNPRPAYGGRRCAGRRQDRVPCFNDQDCPQNGTWCAWGEWNTCSSSCAETTSVRGRQRNCACPTPRGEGADCEGDSMEIEQCTGIQSCNLPDETEWERNQASHLESPQTMVPTNTTPTEVSEVSVATEDSASSNNEP